MSRRNLNDEGLFTRKQAGRELFPLDQYHSLTFSYLFDCDGYHIANPPAGLEEVDSRLAVLARDSARRAAQAAALEDFPGVYNAYSSKLPS